MKSSLPLVVFLFFLGIFLGVAQEKAPPATADSLGPVIQPICPTTTYLRQQSISWSVAARDPSGVREVTLRLETQVLAMQRQGDLWSCDWQPPGDGSYLAEVMAQDEVGNLTLYPMLVIVDSQPAAIRWLSPLEGWISNRPLVVQVAVDEATPLQKVVLLANGQREKELVAGESCWQTIWEPAQEGNYALTVEATDWAGNVGVSLPLSVIVDLTPPEISAEILPSRLEIGEIQLKATLRDRWSPLDLSRCPQIALLLQGQTYPFTLEQFTPSLCRASLLITVQHPVGQGQITISSVADQAGNLVRLTALGEVQIGIPPGGIWPLAPVDQAHSLAMTRPPSSQNLGLWLQAREAAQVFAIEAGQIVELHTSQMGIPGFVRIRRWRGDWAWGYHHLTLGLNPATQRHWQLGDLVERNTLLGTVCPAAGKLSQSFLGLEFLQWVNGQWLLAGDPLAVLHPPSSSLVSPVTSVPLQTKPPSAGQPWRLTHGLAIGYLLLLGLVLLARFWPQRVAYGVGKK